MLRIIYQTIEYQSMISTVLKTVTDEDDNIVIKFVLYNISVSVYM